MILVVHLNNRFFPFRLMGLDVVERFKTAGADNLARQKVLEFGGIGARLLG